MLCQANSYLQQSLYRALGALIDKPSARVISKTQLRLMLG